ncbi:unnamed protein product, partial [Phaeothamnion confervicola]
VWTEPETGLSFLRELPGDGRGRPTQTLIGGGVYTKALMFKIYALAFYADVPRVLAAPELQAFRDAAAAAAAFVGAGAAATTAAARAGAASLMSAMARSSSFDRSISLRLSMAVSRDTAIAAMNSDFDLTPLEKRLLVGTALKSADATCCGAGTELLFTSRRSGDLEVYLDGRLVDTLRTDGLSEGLWRNYVGGNPVSPPSRD